MRRISVGLTETTSAFVRKASTDVERVSVIVSAWRAGGSGKGAVNWTRVVADQGALPSRGRRRASMSVEESLCANWISNDIPTLRESGGPEFPVSETSALADGLSALFRPGKTDGINSLMDA
ncbi:hypothetical protein [Thiocystis violascens]|uniref:hypothetical protein n=1 Tax=Thiocystis violascens TaxID=73141 RepID=UPI00059E6E26|nr:hypothetical protein [Thiocystis violascens]